MNKIKSIVQYIQEYFKNKNEKITQLKVQKLLYFIYGWNLVLLNKKIFKENFQAWINGPVIKKLYDIYSDNLKSNIKLKENEKNLIDKVLKEYGTLDDWTLVSLTHKQNGAWDKTRGGLLDNEKSQKIITTKLIKKEFDYFISN